MDAIEIEIERLGGFGGFGLPGSRIRSHGQVKLLSLTAADRRAIESLFAHPGADAPPVPDGFRYRLTRQGPQGRQSVEAAERDVPAALRDAVKDELI